MVCEMSTTYLLLVRSNSGEEAPHLATAATKVSSELKIYSFLMNRETNNTPRDAQRIYPPNSCFRSSNCEECTHLAITAPKGRYELKINKMKSAPYHLERPSFACIRISKNDEYSHGNSWSKGRYWGNDLQLSYELMSKRTHEIDILYIFWYIK